jgi:hypothetical protein
MNWNTIDWEKVYSVINNADGDLVPEDFTGTWEDVVHANLPKENRKKYLVFHSGEYAVAEYDDTDDHPGFCMEKDEFMFEPEAWAEIEPYTK